MSKPKSFTVLTDRDVAVVQRSLESIKSGMNLIAAVMATSLIRTVIHKAKRKARKVRATRKAKAK